MMTFGQMEALVSVLERIAKAIEKSNELTMITMDRMFAYNERIALAQDSMAKDSNKSTKLNEETNNILQTRVQPSKGRA